MGRKKTNIVQGAFQGSQGLRAAKAMVIPTEDEKLRKVNRKCRDLKSTYLCD